MRIAGGLAVVLGALVLAATTANARRPAAVATVGPAAVGVLFAVDASGRPRGSHFCTGSVVHSRRGDVVVTAAHCVAAQKPGAFAFVPGYRRGRAPLGVWVVRRIFVDSAWASSADPDHDYAFLVVRRRGSQASLESLTGAERLGSGRGVGKRATVVGYPSSKDVAIACRNLLHEFSATQIEFDCGGYTNGTSGSPLVVDPDPKTGLGTVVGVIGGYEQGGDSPSVSYAARLGSSARSLYAAVAAR